MPDFVPFSITVPLLTPVVVKKHPVHFDSLLWYVLGIHYGVEEVQRELDNRLKKTSGVYHASSMLFVPDQDAPIIYRPASHVRSMRAESDLHQDNFAPNGARGHYRKVVVEGGPYKNRFQQHPAYWSRQIRFYACGNPDQIVDFMSFYIGGIGTNANAGDGHCDWSRCQIASETHDLSLMTADGAPNRVLPLQLYLDLTGRVQRRIPDGASVIQSPVSPPYYAGRNEEAILPETIRVA
jgi:hypothetical protein